MAEQPHIVAKPIRPPEVKKRAKNRDILAEVCYYYPQYTLEAASRLPVRDINLLLKTARKERAKDFFQYVQIVTAPHTKKGEGVKTLSDRYLEEMKD